MIDDQRYIFHVAILTHLRRDVNAFVGTLPEFSAVESDDAISDRALLLGVIDRSSDIRRVAARGYSNDDVSGPKQCFELVYKNILVAKIIRCRGHARNIVVQTRDPEDILLVVKSLLRKIIRHVRRAGGASAVTKNKDLTAFVARKKEIIGKSLKDMARELCPCKKEKNNEKNK